MSQYRKVAWRKTVAVGWLVTTGSLFPLIATAQQPAPSGATVEVGGVQVRPAAVEGGQTAPGNVSGAQPQTIEVGGAQARSGEVGGAQSRPIVLPNTGGGPAPDDRPWEFALGGVTVIGVGAYLRWRASRAHLGS